MGREHLNPRNAGTTKLGDKSQDLKGHHGRRDDDESGCDESMTMRCLRLEDSSIPVTSATATVLPRSREARCELLQ